MRYVLMIYADESIVGGLSPEERETYVQDYAAFHQEVMENGIRKGGEPLQPSMTATTVRLQDGKPMITDGPFAETKEQLAGVYILECDDLDHAIALAAKIPDAKHGAIEIRPVMEMY